MIKFIKVLKVNNPERNPLENAGIDVYVPSNTDEFRDALQAKNPALMIINSNSLIEFKDSDIYKPTTFNSVTGVIRIAPHKDVIIPLGIESKFEANLALIANNKSGIATKKKLIFGASVIDAAYQGQWHGHLINTSDDYQELECDQKCIQFIPHYISIEQLEIENKTHKEFYTEKTERGDGWQGSTGLKKENK